MKLLVLGGGGHVGSLVVDLLREKGHQVVVGSRATGVDVVTGEGLGPVMDGVDTVIDVLNTNDMDAAAATAFFRGGTERVLAAEHTTDVRHHVLLSIVGADRARANGYYVGKVAQEDAVRESDIPFTIVRATQFHDFVPMIADWLTDHGQVEAPGMLLQPVDVRDVVDLLVEVAQSTPLNDTVDLAGPEAFALDDLLRSTLRDRSDPRPVVTVDGTALGADSGDSLVPIGPHRTGARPYPVTVTTQDGGTR